MWKALALILVTFSGIVIEARLVQSAKAEMPIRVRLLGRLTMVRLEHALKVDHPMLVMPFGIVILVRRLQLQKAASPNVLTLPGIFTEASSLQR